MNPSMSTQLADLRGSVSWTIPELMLIFGAVVILAIEALAGPPLRKHLEPLVALLTVGLAFLTNCALHIQSAGLDVHFPAFSGLVAIDATTGILRAIILATLFLGYLFTLKRQIWTGIRSEYYSLTMLSAVGAIVMVEASHLLTLVIGLEILSLPLYTLAALRKHDARSREAGLKYFILGSLASGILIFGLALLYGACGSVAYDQLFHAHVDGRFYAIGGMLVLTGLLFKGGLMPFYVWSPDVYEGAPDSIVGLMAALAKVGAFGALLRLTPALFTGLPNALPLVLVVVSAATMLLGNVIALAQTNIKRLLAYSSVAHAGYLLLGILALSHRATAALATSAILFYLATYLITIVAAFALISLLQGPDGRWEIADLEGAASRHPGFAFTLTILMFSLAGVPPLAGFFGKAYVFHAVVGAGYPELAAFGMVTSVISVFYYLRVIVALYFRPELRPLSFATDASAPRYATTFVVIYLILLGLAPSIIYGPAWKAARWGGQSRPFPASATASPQVKQAEQSLFAPEVRMKGR